MGKLYQVSGKKDNYDYAMKSIAWDTPENARNAQPYAPVKLDSQADSILEERFTELKNYSFIDEQATVKVYITFPDDADGDLKDKDALTVEFLMETFDLKFRTPSGKYRCKIDPLFGTIDVDKCKHRVSSSGKKVTLTLAKR